MNIKRYKYRKKFQIGKIKLTLMAEWCSSALWYKSSSKHGMIEIEKLPKEIHCLKDEILKWNNEWMEIASIGMESWLAEEEILSMEKIFDKLEEAQDNINENEILNLKILHNNKGYEIAKKIKELLKYKNFEVFYFDEITNEKNLIK